MLASHQQNVFACTLHWHYVLVACDLLAFGAFTAHFSWAFLTNTLIVGQQSYAVDFLIYAVITQMHTDIY